VNALSPPAPFRSGLVSRPLSACAGASFIVAGAGVAVWNMVARFDHGWWLASFLVLVGGVAQVLLGLGQRPLAQQAWTARPGRAPVRQAALWNTGTLLVPLGVLAGARLPVVLGSVVLLVALCGVARDLRRADARTRERLARHRGPYGSLLVFLAISVLVGTALAWHLPWM
jgi:hypothetical protein